MTAIYVALSSLLLGVLIGRLVLRRYARLLNTKEQSFTFHELRDRLQLLAIEGKIDPTSQVYGFLQFTINMSIKNAGEMSLTGLLGLAKAVNKKMEVPHDVLAEMSRCDAEIQRLAADVFDSLGKMLVSNDRIISILASLAEHGANRLGGVLRSGIRGMAHALMPTHSEAAHEALKYRRWGRRRYSTTAV